MNKNILFKASACLLLAGALYSFRADSDFMAKASQANIAEIEAAKLAITKGSSAKVKAFAKQMISDHTVAQKELVGLAKKEGATLPMEPDADHKAMKQSLSGMSGTAFDSAYMNGQLADHQAAVALFTDESTNGTDAAAKTYATKYLPKLKAHLAMIPMGDSRMGGMNMSTDSTKMMSGMDSTKMMMTDSAK